MRTGVLIYGKRSGILTGVLLYCIFGCCADVHARLPLRLTLQDALQTAARLNLQVMMADARVGQALARIFQARADLLPHLEGDIDGGRQTNDMRAQGMVFPLMGPQIGPYNNVDARLRLNMILFDPSAWQRLQAAQKGQAVSAAESIKTCEDILAVVANLFVDAQRKAQTAALMRSLWDRDQMAYRVSESQYTQGIGSDQEAQQSQSAVDQMYYLYHQAVRQAQDAALDLKAALQLPLDTPLVFIDDSLFLNLLKKSTMIPRSRGINADMLLAQAKLEARGADQKTAYADFLPKISGVADYGRSGESLDKASNTYFVGVKATVPLWEGGANQAQLGLVKGQIKEAQENVLDIRQQAQVNRAKAQSAIIEAQDLIQAKTQERQTAEKALRIALRAWRAGTATALDVMRSKADLAVSEDAYNEAQAAWTLSVINDLHVQGRLRDLVEKTGI